MQFNSLEFLAFCVVFFALWPALRARPNVRWGFITAASFLFYGWWDWRYLFLLVGNGLIDYLAALAIVRWPRGKGWWLGLSLTGNLGTLLLFKYADFVIANLNLALALAARGSSPLPLLHLVLPVGISFYTFQSMSYTIDVYRGQLQPTRNVLHFFAFLSMFPQLVAGPIVRAADLLPQLLTAGPVPEALRWRGTQWIALGLFKKMVISDTVALAANRAFSLDDGRGGCVFWGLATAAFAVQIYCDFSGYSDIARGLANWMGYEFPTNFNHPYAAVGLRDFWGRWHLSLSTWFRDYVYIPLGGSRCGTVRSHLNMAATMVLSGIWHGANWTFLAWGGFHAALLSLERLSRWPERMLRLPGGRFLATAATLCLVLVSWVFFRAESLTQAAHVLQMLLDPRTFTLDDLRLHNDRAVWLTLAVLTLEFRGAVGWRLSAGATPRWLARLQPLGIRLQPLGTALLLVSCVVFRGPGGAFIYFQF